MKKFKSIINEEKDYTNEIIELFKKHKNPDDNKIHALADKLGIEAHDLEGQIYALLSKYINKENN